MWRVGLVMEIVLIAIDFKICGSHILKCELQKAKRQQVEGGKGQIKAKEIGEKWENDRAALVELRKWEALSKNETVNTCTEGAGS